MYKAMNWITSLKLRDIHVQAGFRFSFFFLLWKLCESFLASKCNAPPFEWIFSRHLAQTSYRRAAVCFPARDFAIDFHLNRTQSLQWTKRKWYYVTVALVDMFVWWWKIFQLEIFEPCQNMSIYWKCFSNELETRVMIITAHLFKILRNNLICLYRIFEFIYAQTNIDGINIGHFPLVS